MLNWHDLYDVLRRSSLDTFDFFHIEANPLYDEVNGQVLRLSVDFDAIVFDFTGKYKDKYKVTVRVWNDSHVTATIEIKKSSYFEYPITSEDEHFDERVIAYGPQVLRDDQEVKADVKEIYDWTFRAYRSLVK